VASSLQHNSTRLFQKLLRIFLNSFAFPGQPTGCSPECKVWCRYLHIEDVLLQPLGLKEPFFLLPLAMPMKGLRRKDDSGRKNACIKKKIINW
jgi:hypothetical protein